MYFPIFGTCFSLPLEHCISFFGKVILRELWLFFGRNILVETVALLLLFLRKLKFCSDSSKPASSGRIFEALGPNSAYTVISWLNWPPSWKIYKKLWDCQKTWGNQKSSQTWRNAPVEALWRTLVGVFFSSPKWRKNIFESPIQPFLGHFCTKKNIQMRSTVWSWNLEETLQPNILGCSDFPNPKLRRVFSKTRYQLRDFHLD